MGRDNALDGILYVVGSHVGTHSYLEREWYLANGVDGCKSHLLDALAWFDASTDG